MLVCSSDSNIPPSTIETMHTKHDTSSQYDAILCLPRETPKKERCICSNYIFGFLRQSYNATIVYAFQVVNKTESSVDFTGM